MEDIAPPDWIGYWCKRWPHVVVNTEKINQTAAHKILLLLGTGLVADPAAVNINSGDELVGHLMTNIYNSPTKYNVVALLFDDATNMDPTRDSSRAFAVGTAIWNLYPHAPEDDIKQWIPRIDGGKWAVPDARMLWATTALRWRYLQWISNRLLYCLKNTDPDFKFIIDRSPNVTEDEFHAWMECVGELRSVNLDLRHLYNKHALFGVGVAHDPMYRCAYFHYDKTSQSCTVKYVKTVKTIEEGDSVRRLVSYLTTATATDVVVVRVLGACRHMAYLLYTCLTLLGNRKQYSCSVYLQIDLDVFVDISTLYDALNGEQQNEIEGRLLVAHMSLEFIDMRWSFEAWSEMCERSRHVLNPEVLSDCAMGTAFVCRVAQYSLFAIDEPVHPAFIIEAMGTSTTFSFNMIYARLVRSRWAYTYYTCHSAQCSPSDGWRGWTWLETNSRRYNEIAGAIPLYHGARYDFRSDLIYFQCLDPVEALASPVTYDAFAKAVLMLYNRIRFEKCI